MDLSYTNVTGPLPASWSSLQQASVRSPLPLAWQSLKLARHNFMCVWAMQPEHMAANMSYVTQCCNHFPYFMLSCLLAPAISSHETWGLHNIAQPMVKEHACFAVVCAAILQSY